MRTYEYDDGGTFEDFNAEDMDDAKEKAEEMIRASEWGENITVFVVADITEQGTGNTESISVDIDPDEPDCTEDDHNWSARGTTSKGGGYVITEECLHCQLIKKTDTWAQNRLGEQGLESVEYVQ